MIYYAPKATRHYNSRNLAQMGEEGRTKGERRSRKWGEERGNVNEWVG